MATYRHQSQADQYLKKYPELHRWINVCGGCGARGTRSDLPDNIYPRFNLATEHLREYFRPLALNEIGLCEQCAQAVASLGKETLP